MGKFVTGGLTYGITSTKMLSGQKQMMAISEMALPNYRGRQIKMTTPDYNPALLIIDDEPAIVEMLEMLLEEDFRVTSCVDPSMALSMLQQSQPDLIMVDIMMPVINGIEFLKQLRSGEKTGQIPVVLMTAGNNNSGLSETELKKLNTCLVKKPFDNARLVELLKALTTAPR